MSEYEKIEDFERIIELSKSNIMSGKYKINFNIKVNFDIKLIENSLQDVNQLAIDFQNPKCPENLYINHGEYIHKKGNGVDNVIKELREKNNSNRAIISLINQEDIIGSGDKPIPSFMILQFSIEDGNQLYITVYFRALEVSNFLRINIEEIRIIIESIKSKIINIDKVFLNIFAFRAYIKEDINPLQRAKLDLIKDPKELIELLEEKKTFSTVIEYKIYEDIVNWINKDSSNYIHQSIKKPLIKKLLNNIIIISKEIEDLRTKSSHSHDIDKKQNDYKNKIDKLIKELRNDT